MYRCNCIVNSGEYDGHTPLRTACVLGNVDMVRFLLGKGASTQSVNSSGKCPLHLALKKRAVQKRDDTLLQAWSLSGGYVNLKDYNGRTVMHEAVCLQAKAMISKLLEYGDTPLESNVTS
ncbi:hypothetical protein E1301_Tti018422 [Triplophysa tibetana]|uniref:Uncharacterized protein n=1 Tax=Triplophysa tibetana TaxID=1572043 RepID=A0A5A9PC78_9TELE|nr:hypothetical protein E1301_Tti018422 [Triplophysa tibetana]